jgi:crotonobetaine/carnitine-CoA ligase
MQGDRARSGHLTLKPGCDRRVSSRRLPPPRPAALDQSDRFGDQHFDDSIRRRGENISSFEVEQIIAAHSAVAEATVFPIKVEGNDEEVGAALVLKEGHAVSEGEIIAHCQSNMAYFMVPRFIQFRRELPMTQNGKMEKYKLQQDARDSLASFWDRERAGIQLTR